MPLSVGDRLGPYVILAPIGAGGMGEVYRARDTKLDREVAIKVLPAALAQHPDRLARFEREAKVLASLNHPNIAMIFGIEDRAIVMELVDGPTLADRIRTGPIPLEESLKIAAQIADALEAAHERGIVHRDLKPANVKVREDGTVKVLDFGLATAVQSGAGQPGEGANSPTLTMGATEAGVILGTAAYMSPEQAAGKPVDRRADIWSFGVVLWEMLTGKRLFEGETVSHTLADVLRAPIDFEKLPKGTPERIRELLRRCLDRDIKTRLRDIGEARIAIQKYLANPKSARDVPTTALSRSPFSWTGWAVAAVAIIALLAISFVHFLVPAEHPGGIARFELRLPEKSALGFLKLSPDGRFLAIADLGVRKLQVRALDSLEFRALPGTDNATFPFWSPDSAYIGFFADGKLKKISVNGGPAQTLCDASNGRGGTWNRYGVILFSIGRGSGIQRVAAAGGAPAAVTKLGDYPEFLPDGRHFFYLDEGIYVGSLDGRPPQRILPDLSSAAYVPPTASGGSGYLLFRREETLMAVPFDPQRLRITGDVFPVAEHVGLALFGGNAAFSVSTNGVLAHHAGEATERELELVWIDRSGKRLSAIGKPGRINFEALSPDERTVAYQDNSLSGPSDIWLYDLARDTASRFTFGPGQVVSPIWSPDGSHIVYGADPTDQGKYDIYQKPASGGKEELLLRVGHGLRLYDWSRDGKTLVYVPDVSSATKADLWLLPMEGDHKPTAYLTTQFGEYDAQLSYDGRWMSYTSDESGKEQVNVQPVPPTGAKWQVSTAGGSRARWRRDGKELFYIASDQKLMAVPVKTGSSFGAGAPRELFPTPIINDRAPYEFFYKPSADGQRFLMNIPAEEAASPSITVVLNWQAGLKR